MLLNGLVYNISVGTLIPVIIFGVLATHLAYTIPSLYFTEKSNKKYFSYAGGGNKEVVVAIDLVGIFFSFLFFTTKGALLAISLGILCILYFFGIKTAILRLRSLRSVPFLKSLIIPLIWALTVVYLPLVHKSNEITLLGLVEVFRYFSFFLAIATIFDIADTLFDIKNDLKTFPACLGINASRCVSISSTLLYSLLTFVQFGVSEVFAAAFITSIINSYHAMVASPKEQKSYSINWLDATLIVQPAIYFLLKLYVS